VTGAVILAAAVAIAAAPLPVYERGDAFVYSDGRVERVRRLRGDQVIWSGLSSRRWTRDRNFVVPVLAWRIGDREGRRTVSPGAERLWPLARGKSARFRVVTETRTVGTSVWRKSISHWTCRVGASRTIEIKAGPFEAVPVTCDRYSAATMRLVEQDTWDYAPDLGHYVRRTVIDYRNATRSNIELVAALHGPAATRQRLRALSRQTRRE
jgi:hypothetical protein